MAHEGGYYRFFAYLNLFMFFMLMLVLAANYLLLFVGWEGVGLCSYLLIGFYFEKKFATDAGNKAFIVNRIGDFGFSLAMFLMVKQFGSLDFAHGRSPRRRALAEGTLTRDRPAAAGGRVRQIGAASAVRLAAGRHGRPHAGFRPDPRRHHGHRGRLHDRALVRRFSCTRPSPWTRSPSSASRRRSSPPPSAWRRTISRRFSPTPPCRSSATCSWAWACGAFSAGIFHLMTHAFFKALLFLGAGSVIHALARRAGSAPDGRPAQAHSLDARRPCCARSLAIAGVPFTSGFFSKDAILLAAYAHAPWMYWVGVLTAGMTAFYVFRALFLAFFGEPRAMTIRTNRRP